LINFTPLVTTYIAPLLIERAGASMATVSVFMLVYGVTAAIGNAIGGRVTDGMGANRASVVVVTGITATVLGMYLLSSSVIAMVALTAILGLLTFGAVPPLQARLLSLAELHTPESVGVAAGLNIAGFNSGIVFGSAIGGVTMGALGVAYTPLVAAIAAGLGTLVLLAQLRK
jgi:MFS transporter, DHA1 family, inner membrane transport protein